MSYALLAFLGDGPVGVGSMLMSASNRANESGQSSSGARVLLLRDGETVVSESLGISIIDRVTGE